MCERWPPGEAAGSILILVVETAGRPPQRHNLIFTDAFSENGQTVNITVPIYVGILFVAETIFTFRS